MAFDPGFAQRIRETLVERPGIAEKKMFGGIAFLLHGHMFVGVSGNTLMARVGPTHYADALATRHARPMDFTGRPMKGYVFVDPPGLASDADLARWIGVSIGFVETLPPKATR